MARKKAAAEQADIAASHEEQSTSSTQHVTSIGVYDTRGFLARTYSLDIHGENFRSLAEEFAKKRGWSVR